MPLFELEIKVPAQPTVSSQIKLWINQSTSLDIVESEDSGSTTTILTLFDEDKTTLQLFARALTNQFNDVVSTQIREIPDQVWQQAWNESPESFTTEQFQIILNDDRTAKVSDKIQIDIHAEHAFGDGQHATTRACLRLIEQIYPQHHWQSVLDIGTGTGILAIALAKLGCSRVYGTEISEDLTKIASQNAKRNNICGHWVTTPTPNHKWECFDVIVSNVLIPALYDLMPPAKQLLASGGSLILAGYIEKQLDDLEAHLHKLGFRLRTKLDENGWLATHWS